MADVNEFTVKDALTIRDDMLRTVRNGLIRRGVANPNVGRHTDFFLTATALSNELAVIGANSVIARDEILPDTAGDNGIARWEGILGTAVEGAAGSYGFIVNASSAPTPIATGAQLQDAAGLRYEVITGGTYDDGDLVPVRAIDVGSATNHDEGDALQWAASPPYANDRVFVATGGLVNGVDADTIETRRARVISVFQEPPASGNSADVAQSALEADVRVKSAFVYPGQEGPSSLGVAVLAEPTATEKSRVLSSFLVSGTVAPIVKGKHPEHAKLVVTTVTDVETGVAIGLSLPEARTANPPGPGGGWVNGSPWPAPVDAPCRVTSVLTAPAGLIVDAPTPPTLYVSKVMFLSPLTWRLYTATVTSVSGSAGAYTITLDAPLVGIAVGNYIFPACDNAEAYIAAILAGFAALGPGEKTTNASVLLRAFRHPPPSQVAPYALGPNLLRPLTAITEVSAAQFFYRTDGTTVVAGSSGTLVPAVPAAASDPPKVFVPKNIGLYRI